MLSKGLVKRSLHQSLSFVVASGLIAPQLSFANGAAQTEWIFPGQQIPADVGYSPLRVSSTSQSDVRVIGRDWFLLKNKDLALANPASSKALDYVGPVLDENNGHIYYRLVTGMILKESLVQLGMNSIEAKRFMDQVKAAGHDFETTPLEQMGNLPKGMDELYRNWSRPLARLAVLPYLVAPLSISYDQSNFQHFSVGQTGSDKNSADGKTCSTINSVIPIGTIQAKIDDRQKNLDQLSTDVRAATTLFEQANSGFIHLTRKVTDQSAAIDKSMQCFGVVRDRVARGAEMPNAECLALGKAVLEEQDLGPRWDKFVSVNLQNPKGDFKVRQEEDIALKVLESTLQVSKSQIQSLQDTRTKLQKEQQISEEKIKKLDDDRARQQAADTKLSEEEAALTAEFEKLQSVAHKLESGAMSKEASEEQVKAAIASTASRNQRVTEIKARLPKILQEKSKIQANMAAISSQSEFLERSIDNNRLESQSITARLGTDQGGLLADVASQEKVVAEASKKFVEALDRSNYSEYIISLLSKKLILMTQARDKDFDLLRKEEVMVNQRKAQIAASTKAKDARWEQLQREKQELEALIASYRGDSQMGWFLETDCASREKHDKNALGIYLSRAPVTEQNTTGVADAGRWGMFNLSYKGFQSSVQNGVLLNVPAYIQLSVRQIFENYDYATTQFMDPLAGKCSDLNTSGPLSGSIVGLIKSAFAIWDEGSGTEGKAKGYCRIADNQNSASSAANRSFKASLDKMVSFEGSLLDMVLPTANSQGDDLIERKAIMAVVTELGTITGMKTPVAGDNDSRRENLIKSLIKVLAYDYEAEMVKTQNRMAAQSKFKFATTAPGRGAEKVPAIAVGSEHTLRTLGEVKLYSAPISRPQFEAGVTLVDGNKVRVVAIDDKKPEDANRGGWLKVRTIDQNQNESEATYFMSVMPIAFGSRVDENGNMLFDLSDPTKCPVRRLVTTLTNFERADTEVTRILPDIKTAAYKGGMFQMVRNNTKATSAYTDRTYVACELFSVDGQRASPRAETSYKSHGGVDFRKVQGIRIIEVRKVTTREGKVRYVPTEDVGGFVHTWLPLKNVQQPRILLGPQLDAKTWSAE